MGAAHSSAVDHLRRQVLAAEHVDSVQQAVLTAILLRMTASPDTPADDLPPRGATMRKVASNRHTAGLAEVYKPGELIKAALEGPVLSRGGMQALAMMLHAAGDKADADVRHMIPKVALRGSTTGTDRFRKVLKELQQTVFDVPCISPQGKAARKTVPVLVESIEEVGDDNRAMFYWRFSDEMRFLIRTSKFYAILRPDTVQQIESRYAMRLYEIGALYARRKYPRWSPTLEELRTALGVDDGKLSRWPDLQKIALEPALREINHIAHFHALYKEIRQGQRVSGVDLHFAPKKGHDRQETQIELLSGREGRAERREKKVKAVKIVENPEALGL